MAALDDLRLVLFFTENVSLDTWHRLGTLERELAVYRACRPELREITLVTYGGPEDLRHAAALPEFRVVCNRWALPARLYRGYLGEVLPRFWRGPTAVKTNQIPGADLALRAARRSGAHFIARCGYLRSANAAIADGPDAASVSRESTREMRAFEAADRIVLTSDALKDRVVERHGIDAGRICVVPNAIDTTLFQPRDESATLDSRRVVYVGRLDERDKNLKALLEACAGLDVDLQLVGAGPSEGDLRAQAAASGQRVQFFGNQPNRRVAELLAGCGLFVLPSHYEGHPKALLEAMAAGVPVVASDVPGIQDLVRHRETGFLCQNSAESLREAITDVLADRGLRRQMAVAARTYAVENVALERVVERELAVLREVVALKTRHPG